jgi:hypothetical protein
MNFFKWCKKLGVDSSNDYYTLELRIVKEYNNQLWFDT